ncbi:MAG: DEAD/DEAH box helicase [Verrucomicrobiales bacterium]|nr:DEAD/DEAH box helicase [Verrucomicrobiales bacterium]
MPAAKKGQVLPPNHDWRTSDEDEIERRRLRAREEKFRFENLDPRHPICSNFRVHSPSAQEYEVEVRDPLQRIAICSCIDFRVNGLGTCKHIEGLWMHLRRRVGAAWAEAQVSGSSRFEVVPDFAMDRLRLLRPPGRRMSALLRRWFNDEGLMLAEVDPVEATQGMKHLATTRLPDLRVSLEVERWLDHRRRRQEQVELRREYELKVQSGEWPAHETLVPLFPYQRDGMLHLAFTERALLADEMGLGKTIQAIAACALLHRLGRARRVLVVTPASLKAEWEEQIRRFTALPCHLVYGGHHKRVQWLRNLLSPPHVTPTSEDPFFVIMNYEQVVSNLPEVNAMLKPDVVVLDEAQRIKNWNTKVARTIKKLKSRYAFILTGTPIENRIDELRSLVDFLDPAVLGPLFRFNREFYRFDDRGRPTGYQNLDVLHRRIQPLLLRRRKAEIETELPPRTDEFRFVKMADTQRRAYATHEQEVMRLVTTSERRPLTESEQERMLLELGMMRMTCDTPYILDSKNRVCPKLAELIPILENCRDNDLQLIVFSEWERMLELVRDVCDERGIGYAWHTGSVPQQKRRGEILRFKQDPRCRAFLSTDAGATGLNLQNASVVVHCDLPWNPARLDQRTARAWRKHQTRNVTVIHLIAEDTIEHRMLETLAVKRTVAESVLDQGGAVKELELRSGRKAAMERVKNLVGESKGAARAGTGATQEEKPMSAPDDSPQEADKDLYRKDPAAAFARAACDLLGSCIVNCEERFPSDGRPSSILFVVRGDQVLIRDRLSDFRAEFLGAHGDEWVSSNEDRSPVRFQVIDESTHETMQRLIEAGLLASTVKFARPLVGAALEESATPSLTAEEKAAVQSGGQQASRLVRRARVLGEAGFDDECRASLEEAVMALSKSLAIRGRLPVPENLAAVIAPPFARVWGAGLAAVAPFVRREATGWGSFAGALEEQLAALAQGDQEPNA